jgi:hypothetical protein
MPYEWSESDINGPQEAGAKELSSATSGRPRFGRPDMAGSPATRDRLLSALMGFRSGMELSQGMINQGNPVGAALMGLAGGFTGPTPEDVYNQRAQQQAKTSLAQFESTPISKVSPRLAEKYPEIADLPMAAVPHISPLLQKSEAMETAMAIASIREQMYRDRLTEMSTLGAVKQALEEKKAIEKERHDRAIEAKGAKPTIADQIRGLEVGSSAVVVPTIERMAKGPGDVKPVPYISMDGGKTWLKK